MMQTASLPVLSRSVYSDEVLEGIFRSFQKDDIESVNFAVTLALDFIEKGESEFLNRTSGRFLAVLLTLLRGVNENVLTNRILISYRKEVERACRTMTLEDVEGYSIRLGIDANLEFEEECISVSLRDYVGIAGRISGSTHHLIFQELRHGRVFLNRDQVAKLLREYFYNNVRAFYDSLTYEGAVRITSPYQKETGYVRELYLKNAGKNSPELGEVEAEKFPPCIKEYVKQVSEGINIPHLARFTMVSFLHKIGLQNNSIMEIFRTAPDFNEKITSYQVNHITGESSGTQYSPPKCVTLQSNHLCYKGDDPLCNKEWLKHPLRYYEIKKSAKERGVKKS